MRRVVAQLLPYPLGMAFFAYLLLKDNQANSHITGRNATQRRFQPTRTPVLASLSFRRWWHYCWRCHSVVGFVLERNLVWAAICPVAWLPCGFVLAVVQQAVNVFTLHVAVTQHYRLCVVPSTFQPKSDPSTGWRRRRNAAAGAILHYRKHSARVKC